MEQLNIFIDTNVFLGFYAYNKDDIDELNKIAKLVKTNKIKLYLTEQVVHEFSRNRENKINETLKPLKNYKFPNIPRFMDHYPEVVEYRETVEKLNRLHDKLMEKAKADSIEKLLPADKLLDEIIKEAKEIKIKDEVKQLAKWRLDRGDPPGKQNSIGDSLNWEILLKEVPENVDLHIITLDNDYRSLIDSSNPHPVLQNEWKKLKKGELFIYDHLVPFIIKHFPDIKVSSDIEKDYAINSLIDSRSFNETHSAIKNLQPLINLLDDNDRNKISDAGLINDQIFGIGTDTDIQRFYSSIFKNSMTSYSREDIEKIKSMFNLY